MRRQESFEAKIKPKLPDPHEGSKSPITKLRRYLEEPGWKATINDPSFFKKEGFLPTTDTNNTVAF